MIDANADARPSEGTTRWPLATRVNSFRAEGTDVETALRAIGRVPGITALELNVPQHLRDLPEQRLGSLLDETGLRLTALNLRFDDPSYRAGAFTNPRRQTRERAIGLALEAVEQADRFGVDHVVLWLEGDGYDYPFQVDYERLWELAIDGFRRVAAHHPGVRISVEYKPRDPRRFSLIRTVGDALLATRDVGLPNMGVTVDLCHALITGEHPPAAAALALREGRLFGVHLNDGGGWEDDGQMVGSVRPWILLELLSVLRSGGYRGTLYFDTFPHLEDPAAECAANVATVRRFEGMLDSLEFEALAEVRERQDAVGARALIDRLLFSPHGS